MSIIMIYLGDAESEQNSNILKMLNNLKLSIEEAMAAAGVPASEHERYATSIRKLAK